PLHEIGGLTPCYPHFRTEPPAKVTLRACHDLSCWLQGADRRIAALRERYGADAEIEVAEASCLGRCDTPPAVAVNECPGAIAEADALIAAARAGHLAAYSPRSYASGAPWPNDPYPPGAARYRVLRAVLSADLDPGGVTAALRAAGLGGRGGAGSPAAGKGERVAAQPATPKYAICNADESEPGTFKDRQILAEQPHLVLEGLLLGMVAVGAEEGWVFI